jgi:CRP-like cAMP-binding protein
MFFIAKGECGINVRTPDRVEKEMYKRLQEGEHFGEIAMIYKCRRSATVISLNYNTIAKLGEE